MTSARHDVRDYGAVAEDDSLETERANAKAFMKALAAANQTEVPEGREVYVPEGMTFHMMPVWGEYITNMTITIDGTILASKRHTNWPWTVKHDSKHPEKPPTTQVRKLFDFYEVHNFSIVGKGTVDGQGYMWWIREYLGTNHYGRPHLMYIHSATNLEMAGVRYINAAYYHIEAVDFDGAYFHDFEIFVNVKGQLELGKLFASSGMSGSFLSGINDITLPTFPLNTDGLDPHGANALIERLNITNYDDAVAIKPLNKKHKYAQCAENILVRDCNVWFGVGMTIGSVSATDNYDCIRNITFDNHRFYNPFKAIYVKSNPAYVSHYTGEGPGGEISNIVYNNIEIHRPIWWAIYIGPQQQNQPHQGGDPGCLLYPLNDCATVPVVTIKDIKLYNVNVYDSILPPGIMRCNETNPCTGFVWENVQAHGWWSKLGIGYMTENVYGEVRNSKPVPQIITTEGDGYVGNDDLPDLVDLVWHKIVGAITGTFGYSDAQDQFRKEFFETVGMFETAYRMFTQ